MGAAAAARLVSAASRSPVTGRAVPADRPQHPPKELPCNLRCRRDENRRAVHADAHAWRLAACVTSVLTLIHFVAGKITGGCAAVLALLVQPSPEGTLLRQQHSRPAWMRKLLTRPAPPPLPPSAAGLTLVGLSHSALCGGMVLLARRRPAFYATFREAFATAGLVHLVWGNNLLSEWRAGVSLPACRSSQGASGTWLRKASHPSERPAGVAGARRPPDRSCAAHAAPAMPCIRVLQTFMPKEGPRTLAKRATLACFSSCSTAPAASGCEHPAAASTLAAHQPPAAPGCQQLGRALTKGHCRAAHRYCPIVAHATSHIAAPLEIPAPASPRSLVYVFQSRPMFWWSCILLPLAVAQSLWRGPALCGRLLALPGIEAPLRRFYRTLDTVQ